VQPYSINSAASLFWKRVGTSLGYSLDYLGPVGGKDYILMGDIRVYMRGSPTGFFEV